MFRNFTIDCPARARPCPWMFQNRVPLINCALVGRPSSLFRSHKPDRTSLCVEQLVRRMSGCCPFILHQHEICGSFLSFTHNSRVKCGLSECAVFRNGVRYMYFQSTIATMAQWPCCGRAAPNSKPETCVWVGFRKGVFWSPLLQSECTSA